MTATDLPGAAAPEVDALRIFSAVLVVGVIALLLTSRRAATVRRRPVVSALISGGWVAIATGLLLGPNMLNVVRGASLLEVRPMLIVGLGWVGLIIGMQARREVLKIVPRSLWMWVIVDGLVSAIIIGIGAGVILFAGFPADHSTLPWVYLPALMLMACAVGWSPETRSIRTATTTDARHIAMLIQAGAGLSGIVAVLLFGTFAPAVRRVSAGPPQIDFGEAVVLLVAGLVLALFIGGGGRWLLRQAGKDRPQLLVATFGLIALLAGIASEFGFSPMLVTMVAGIVLVNVARERPESFERLTQRAEQPMAMMFYLLAGILLDPLIGWWGVALVALLVSFRIVVKPAVMLWILRESRPAPVGAISHEFLNDPTMRWRLTAPIRQAPVAIALAVALVAVEPSPLHSRLLAIIVLSGLICDVVPIAIALRHRRRVLGEDTAANRRADAGSTGRGAGS